MDGGAGVDTADYSDAPDYIYAYLGWNGGATNDVYDGTGGMDTLSNFEKLIGSAHNDAFNIQTPLTMEIDGGGGYDFLLFSDAAVGMTARLAASGVSAVIMDGKALQIKNIEAVYGSQGADVFIVTDRMNSPEYPGAVYTLTGNAGADQFHIEANAEARITDYSGDDTVYLKGYKVQAHVYGNENGSNLYGMGEFYDVNGLRYQIVPTAPGSVELRISGPYNPYDVLGTTDYAVVTLHSDQVSYSADGMSLQFANITLDIGHPPGYQPPVIVDGIVISEGNPGLLPVAGSGDLGDHSGTSGDDVQVAPHEGGTLTGGTGKDNLIGGSGADLLDAGAGNDVVFAMAGVDTVIAGHGGGDDYYDGGADADTIRFESTTLGVVVNLQTGTADGAETGHDTLVNIEHVVGGSGKDTLTGNDLANTLSGGAGADTIAGGAGDDQLLGGAGNDTLLGGAGTDYINGDGDTNYVSYADSPAAVFVNISPYSNQNLGGHVLAARSGLDGWGDVDTYANIKGIIGSAYNDWLLGSDLSDYIYGGAGDDHLLGSWGNDIMLGEAGNDVIDGNGGNNTLAFTSSPAGVTVNLATHVVEDGFGTSDSFVDISNVTGSQFADSLTGDDLANILRAGKGNDLLAGGLGADTFVYANGDNTDTVTDYQDGVDHFEIKAITNNFANLTITDSAEGAKISWGASDLIIVVGTSAAQLGASDFIFTT